MAVAVATNYYSIWVKSMENPPYTTKLSKASRKALLEALNEIAVSVHSDTVVWATMGKDGKIRYWYAPAQCKKSERTKEDFVEQFESKEMASHIVRFVEQGYIG